MISLHRPVVAVDVGYGHTKHFVSTLNDVPQFASCPSTVVYSSSTLAQLAVEVATRDVTIVDVDGLLCLVGLDVESTNRGSAGETPRDETFVQSAAYMALLRGALTRTGATEIDVLQLGLPYNLMHSHATLLHDRAIGKHSLVDRQGHRYECLVKAVQVQAQPVAAFTQYVMTLPESPSQENTVLLIDVGYLTINWVVARGTHINANRSGATRGGMSRVIEQVAEGLGRQLGVTIDRIHWPDIAAAITASNKRVRISGTHHDISGLVDKAIATTSEFVSTVFNRVGPRTDLSAIVLCGGGAQMLVELVRQVCPAPEPVVLRNPQFAIVAGLQDIGEASDAADA